MEVPVILDLLGICCPGSRVKALASTGSFSAFPHSFESTCVWFSSVQFLIRPIFSSLCILWPSLMVSFDGLLSV